MKGLITAVLLTGVILIGGCGKKVQGEGGLFETLSTEETDGAWGTEASREVMERKAVEGSKPAAVKEPAQDGKKPEENTSADSRTPETLPKTSPSPRSEKAPVAESGKTSSAEQEKTAEPVQTMQPIKTAEPVKAAEPSQAPASSPEPAAEPEQPPTPAHAHTYVEETKAATCTDAALTTTRCSSCGEVSGTRTEGGTLGHDWEKVVYSAPTCSMKGYGYSQCKRCGLQQDFENIDYLPHDYEVTVVLEGDCQSPRITEKVCRVCNTHEPREYDNDVHKDDHDWVTGTFQVWSDEKFAMVDVTRTCCARCGKDRE